MKYNYQGCILFFVFMVPYYKMKKFFFMFDLWLKWCNIFDRACYDARKSKIYIKNNEQN